ncbi:hypothetical protein ACMXYX_17950 (plasmid) [Neptuniibacter sp. QD72_48]|uniref:hypothetical protein n=1 Tax=Neptuniibacter sp. QD72_48 TaxID=3398214 RepID=UPI0039F4DC0A
MSSEIRFSLNKGTNNRLLSGHRYVNYIAHLEKSVEFYLSEYSQLDIIFDINEQHVDLLIDSIQTEESLRPTYHDSLEYIIEYFWDTIEQNEAFESEEERENVRQKWSDLLAKSDELIGRENEAEKKAESASNMRDYAL